MYDKPGNDAAPRVSDQTDTINRRTRSSIQGRPPSEPVGTAPQVIPASCGSHSYNPKKNTKVSSGSNASSQVVMEANENKHAKGEALA